MAETLTIPLTVAPYAGDVMETLDDAVAAAPVPDIGTDCGLAVALSAMLRVADSKLDVEGWKVILMTQVEPVATELPQVLVWVKSAALEPAMAMLEKVTAEANPLVRVRDRCAVPPTV